MRGLPAGHLLGAGAVATLMGQCMCRRGGAGAHTAGAGGDAKEKRRRQRRHPSRACPGRSGGDAASLGCCFVARAVLCLGKPAVPQSAQGQRGMTGVYQSRGRQSFGCAPETESCCVGLWLTEQVSEM